MALMAHKECYSLQTRIPSAQSDVLAVAHQKRSPKQGGTTSAQDRKGFLFLALQTMHGTWSIVLKSTVQSILYIHNRKYGFAKRTRKKWIRCSTTWWTAEERTQRLGNRYVKTNDHPGLSSALLLHKINAALLLQIPKSILRFLRKIATLFSDI